MHAEVLGHGRARAGPGPLRARDEARPQHGQVIGRVRARADAVALRAGLELGRGEDGVAFLPVAGRAARDARNERLHGAVAGVVVAALLPSSRVLGHLLEHLELVRPEKRLGRGCDGGVAGAVVAAVGVVARVFRDFGDVLEPFRVREGFQRGFDGEVAGARVAARAARALGYVVEVPELYTTLRD